jgi:sugar phosphate isomerase/epimerase
MRFGVCGGPEMAETAAVAGYDYFEWGVQALLKPREPRAAFLDARARAASAALPCEACNVFLPADLKIVGPVVDTPAIDTYVRTACERAAEARLATIVFGSGGARRIPDGFPRERAMDQIHAFLELAARHAESAGITIVVEPLRRQECNVLNTVDECAEVVRKARSPAIRLLVDDYHWAHNGETAASIEQQAPLFRHMHVSTKPNRRTPAAEPCPDLEAFLATVRKIGYGGRISIEASIQNPAAELPAALRLMKEQLGIV